jgi:hypothetical protein
MPPVRSSAKKNSTSDKSDPIEQIFGKLSMSKKNVEQEQSSQQQEPPQPYIFSFPKVQPNIDFSFPKVQPNAESYDCAEYLKPEYFKRLPYLYQPSEFTGKHIVETNKDYLDKVKIHPQIQQAFLENASNAKNATVQKILKDLQSMRRGQFFNNYKTLLEQFYGAVSVHSKSTFYETLKHGFEWIKKQIDLSKQPWVLVTENYVTNVKRAHIPTVNYIPFKSSEWVGKLFQTSLDENQKSKCVVDIGDIQYVVSEENPPRYVLFDDGAYSGSQKGLILSTFIHNLLPKRKHTTVYLVIPYYTIYALNRFRININGSVETLNKNNSLGVECEYRIEPDKDVYILTAKNNNTLNIVIWKGGVEMEESVSIINRLTGADKDTLEAFMKEFKSIDSLGATLTLFEHKVPDFMSLNAKFGNIFIKEKIMTEHYKHNPPYKVFQTPEQQKGGCGCGKKSGGRSAKRLKEVTIRGK